jgi:ankyrin repeat protein
MRARRIARVLGTTSVLALGLTAATFASGSEAPVADAAEQGDLEQVRALLRDGADVNAAQPDGMTALHWAATRGADDIVQVVLYAGAALQSTTRLGGYTALHLASRGGHAAVVERLLEHGADPNRLTTTGVTALHFAADADAADVIAVLAAHGADVDAQDGHSQRTPLMFAAARDANRAVAALLSAGADVSMQTRVKDYEEIDRLNREEQAQRRRIREAAKEPEDAPEEDPEEDTAVATPPQAEPTAQAAAADPAATREVTPHEPEERPEVKELTSTQQIGKQGGFTALHYAAREGHRDVARLILEGGADVNQVTAGDRSSPLLVAVINGNYDLARDLLGRGADPNLMSDDGAGPLFATLNIEWSLRTWYPQPSMFRQQETTYLELMQLLLDAGADPNARTTTHIWYAAYNAGRMGVDFTGATPFWRAAYAADVNAMRLLVDNGANPDISTIKLPSRSAYRDPDIPTNPANDEPEPADPSGLPPVPVGGPGVHPLHAASGVGFGTSRVAQQHRHVPGGWLPSVRFLIEEIGVDPNLRDMDGYTAVHHAAARGDNETILYLVGKGADVTLISRRGQTTADMANSPEQRAQPIPVTVALLEKLGSKNNHRCQSCGGG